MESNIHHGILKSFFKKIIDAVVLRLGVHLVIKNDNSEHFWSTYYMSCCVLGVFNKSTHLMLTTAHEVGSSIISVYR